MEYLHTMVRASNLDESLDFYCNKLGLVELKRYDNDRGRFTLVFLAAPGDEGEIEKVLREAAKGPAYHARFNGRTLIVPESALEFFNPE